MKAKPLRIVTKDEFWARERSFAKAHSAREAHLPLDAQAKNYDLVYDALVRELGAIGSIAEGGLSDAAFSTSRYVDPNDVTVVVSDTDTVFLSGALDAALAAIRSAAAPHMVVFDTGSYVAVLPDGSVIGYSDYEDLLAYDQQRSA